MSRGQPWRVVARPRTRRDTVVRRTAERRMARTSVWEALVAEEVVLQVLSEPFDLVAQRRMAVDASAQSCQDGLVYRYGGNPLSAAHHAAAPRAPQPITFPAAAPVATSTSRSSGP